MDVLYCNTVVTTHATLEPDLWYSRGIESPKNNWHCEFSTSSSQGKQGKEESWDYLKRSCFPQRRVAGQRQYVLSSTSASILSAVNCCVCKVQKQILVIPMDARTAFYAHRLRGAQQAKCTALSSHLPCISMTALIFSWLAYFLLDKHPWGVEVLLPRTWFFCPTVQTRFSRCFKKWSMLVCPSDFLE